MEYLFWAILLIVAGILVYLVTIDVELKQIQETLKKGFKEMNKDFGSVKRRQAYETNRSQKVVKATKKLGRKAHVAFTGAGDMKNVRFTAV